MDRPLGAVRQPQGDGDGLAKEGGRGDGGILREQLQAKGEGNGDALEPGEPGQEERVLAQRRADTEGAVGL